MSQDITPFEFSEEEIPREFINGEWWYLLRAVCKKLGMADATARGWGQRLPKETVQLINYVNAAGKQQPQNFVNKAGIRIILTSSNVEVAQQIQEWLGAEVFEAIVEEGGYVAPWTPMAKRLRIAERLEYRNITDMLAETTDYDPKSWVARQFFARMQNLFHKHVTGMDAMQLKANREIVTWEDQSKPPKDSDLKIGKNFLTPEELEISGLTLVAVMANLRLKFYKKPPTMEEFIQALKKELKKIKDEQQE